MRELRLWNNGLVTRQYSYEHFCTCDSKHEKYYLISNKANPHNARFFFILHIRDFFSPHNTRIFEVILILRDFYSELPSNTGTIFF